MNVVPTECKLIEFPKQAGDDRSFNKEFAGTLAQSIKAEGMHQPIVIRPNVAKPGHFIGICGRHRFFAVNKILKEQSIAANVVADMDDAEAAMATIAENLWRNPLTKAQHAKAVKTWWEYFQAKNLKPTNKAPVKAEEAADTESKAETEEAAQAASRSNGEAAFVKNVAAATGQTEPTVRRTAKIARSFTAEQLEIFDQMKTTQGDMLTIAKIKDEVQRSGVVNLVLAGMEVAEAIKEITKEAAPTKYNAKKAKAEAAAVAKEDPADNLSDTEWFELYCGAKAAMLANPAKFRADALLFRLISDARHTFRIAAQGSVKKIKAASPQTGAFWNLVNRFISISHPKDWHLCPECAGKGVVADPTKSDAGIAKFGPGFGMKTCPKCFGAGYSMKTEEYL